MLEYFVSSNVSSILGNLKSGNSSFFFFIPRLRSSDWFATVCVIFTDQSGGNAADATFPALAVVCVFLSRLLIG